METKENKTGSTNSFEKQLLLFEVLEKISNIVSTSDRLKLGDCKKDEQGNIMINLAHCHFRNYSYKGIRKQFVDALEQTSDQNSVDTVKVNYEWHTVEEVNNNIKLFRTFEKYLQSHDIESFDAQKDPDYIHSTYLFPDNYDKTYNNLKEFARYSSNSVEYAEAILKKEIKNEGNLPKSNAAEPDIEKMHVPIAKTVYVDNTLLKTQKTKYKENKKSYTEKCESTNNYYLQFTSEEELKTFFNSINCIIPNEPSYIKMFIKAIREAKVDKAPPQNLSNEYMGCKNLKEFIPVFFKINFKNDFTKPDHVIKDFEELIIAAIEYDTSLLTNQQFFALCINKFHQQKAIFQQKSQEKQPSKIHSALSEKVANTIESDIPGLSIAINSNTKAYNEDRGFCTQITKVADEFTNVADAMHQYINVLNEKNADLEEGLISIGTGACVDIVAYDPVKNEVTITKVGDTITVCIYSYKDRIEIENLTSDHSCDDLFERKIISYNGGEVTNLDESGFRTLADIKEKEDSIWLQPSRHIQGVKNLENKAMKPHPDSITYKVEDRGQQSTFILSSTDGIWETINEDQLAKMLEYVTGCSNQTLLNNNGAKNQSINKQLLSLRNGFKETNDFGNLSYYICEIARICGSNDNLGATCLCVEKFKRDNKDKQNIVVFGAIDAHGDHTRKVSYKNSRCTDGELLADKTKECLETELPLFIATGKNKLDVSVEKVTVPNSTDCLNAVETMLLQNSKETLQITPGDGNIENNLEKPEIDSGNSSNMQSPMTSLTNKTEETFKESLKKLIAEETKLLELEQQEKESKAEDASSEIKPLNSKHVLNSQAAKYD